MHSFLNRPCTRELLAQVDLLVAVDDLPVIIICTKLKRYPSNIPIQSTTLIVIINIINNDNKCLFFFICSFQPLQQSIHSQLAEANQDLCFFQQILPFSALRHFPLPKS